MTQTTTPLNPLTTKETIEFDHAVLADLCNRHGHEAEAVIASTLGQIENLLVLAKLQLNSAHLAGLARTCVDLISLARSIGMGTLEHAAHSVLNCVAAGNDVALPACTRRMLRLGQPDTIEQWAVRHDTVA